MAMHSLMNCLAAASRRMGALGWNLRGALAMLLSGVRLPWMGTAALLAANLSGFGTLCLIGGWPYALGFGEVGAMQAHYDRYGVLPLSWTIAGRPVWPGWLTGMFLHTGPWHLACNCFWILVFGRQYGWIALPMYLWGGLAASAVYALLNPYSQVPAVGASAALSALLGGLLSSGRLPLSPLAVGRCRVPGSLLLGCFAAVLAMQGLQQQWDVLGLHIAGGAAGLLGGWMLMVVSRRENH